MIHVEAGDVDEVSDMELAKAVGDTLCKCYPNHPWLVSFQGRAIVVRHLAIASEVARVIGREGFSAMLPKDQLGTPKAIAHTAMLFGGQLLEAFGLKRGAWDGTAPTVPATWKRKTEAKFQ